MRRDVMGEVRLRLNLNANTGFTARTESLRFGLRGGAQSRLRLASWPTVLSDGVAGF